MYENFLNNHSLQIGLSEKKDELVTDLDFQISFFFVECGGKNIDSGVYKTHSFESSKRWAILISNYFPKYRGRIIPFGYDWMSRQFAIDKSRENYILMFDPATSEDFEIQKDIVTFHNHDLVYEMESTVSELLFNSVMSHLAINNLNYNDCLGYRIPLVLGGTDTTNNYEISDVEVYWEMMCQIYLQTKDLPPGTKISSIKWKSK